MSRNYCDLVMPSNFVDSWVSHSPFCSLNCHLTTSWDVMTALSLFCKHYLRLPSQKGLQCCSTPEPQCLLQPAGGAFVQLNKVCTLEKLNMERTQCQNSCDYYLFALSKSNHASLNLYCWLLEPQCLVQTFRALTWRVAGKYIACAIYLSDV